MVLDPVLMYKATTVLVISWKLTTAIGKAATILASKSSRKTKGTTQNVICASRVYLVFY